MSLKFCSQNVECMTLKWRRLYLPRDPKAAIIVAVYVTPSANLKDVMDELCSGISELQTIHPDAFYLMTGDFNKASLKSVLT